MKILTFLSELEAGYVIPLILRLKLGASNLVGLGLKDMLHHGSLILYLNWFCTTHNLACTFFILFMEALENKK